MLGTIEKHADNTRYHIIHLSNGGNFSRYMVTQLGDNQLGMRQTSVYANSSADAIIKARNIFSLN